MSNHTQLLETVGCDQNGKLCNVTKSTPCYTDLNSKWFLEKEPLGKSKKCVEPIFRKMCVGVRMHTHYPTHTGPSLRCPEDDFWLYDGGKWYTSSGNCTSDLERWSFPRLAISSMILSCDARQLGQLPVGQATERVEQPIQPTECCVAGVFGCCILCLHIPSCLQNAHQCLSCFRGEEEEGNYSWGETQDNCPTES